MSLKPTERDNILMELKATTSRLDERSLNQWNTTEKIEKHLGQLNDNVKQNTIRSFNNQLSINKLWKVLLGGFSVLFTIIGVVAGLSKLMGLY